MRAEGCLLLRVPLAGPPCAGPLAARGAVHWGAWRPAGAGGHVAACPQVTAEEAREHWENSYALSLTHCSHTAW